MSLPAKYDLQIYSNSRYSKTLELLNSSNEIIDLTDYTAKLQVRDGKNDKFFLELNTENGGIVIEEEAGRVTFIFNNEAREALKENGRYDLVLFDKNGEPQTYTSGEVFIIKGVTR